MTKETTMTATAFKAKCLRLMDDLQARRLSKVTITKHGSPVATLQPVTDPPDRPLHGAHKGRARFDPTFDPFTPVADPDDWDADAGILFQKR